MNPLEPHNINLDQSILDKYVYRVFSLEKFLDIFAQDINSLTLVKPRLWDDPFENFLLQNVAWADDGQGFKFDEICEKLHGQCWTLNEDTDFIWRVYSPNKDGIKVKVKIRTLIENFIKPNNTKPDLCFIGQVEYHPWNDIKKFYEDTSFSKLMADTSGHSIAYTLLLKRPEFQPENEIRVIYWSESFYGKYSDIIYLGVEPNKLFEEVTLDPRMDELRFISISKIIKKIGYTGPINQSTLYSFPELRLKI
jgi:hypothetical protein